MSVAAGASADAVRCLLPGVEVLGHERQVSTDQANLSIAVDERWLVKWFTRPVRHDDLACVEQLARVRFAHMPVHVGAVDGDRTGEVVAVVSELVADATDGWQWYVDDVLAWLDGRSPLGPLVSTAARMGAITAALHHALAIDHPPVAAPADDLRRTVAERRAQALAHTSGSAGDRLRERIDRIDTVLAQLDDVDEVLVQRVHGDLHAGQFLRAGDVRNGRLLVIDFDGDPMTDASLRLARQPVERDLAGLLQSLDHVARVAAKRRPGADVSPFVLGAIQVAEAAYREAHPVDDRLLLPLRVAQELHEFAYAGLHLPVWTYVPEAAIQSLFPPADPQE